MSGHDNFMIVVGAVLANEASKDNPSVRRIVVKQENITQSLREPGVLVDNSMLFTTWVSEDLVPSEVVLGSVVEVHGRLRKPKITKQKNSEGKIVEYINLTMDVRHPISIHERLSVAERVAKKALA
jgi:ribosomal protein L35AE/L33A